MSKKYILLIVLVLTASLLSGCSNTKKLHPIEDVNHLDGQQVGVMLSYGTDYVLTKRSDMTLTRYNRLSDLIASLCYRRLDAIAMEEVYIPHILSSVSGLHKIEEPFYQDGIVAIAPGTNESLIKEFNEFISEFQKTEDYKDLIQRCKSEEGYTYKNVPLSDGDKSLKVATTSDNYPFSYINFENNEYEGIDIEIIRHFANAYGYHIELTVGSWEAMDMGIYYGQYDIALSGISNLYREDYTFSGSILVSDIYMPVDMYYIEVKDPAALKINAEIED